MLSAIASVGNSNRSNPARAGITLCFEPGTSPDRHRARGRGSHASQIDLASSRRQPREHLTRLLRHIALESRQFCQQTAAIDPFHWNYLWFCPATSI